MGPKIPLTKKNKNGTQNPNDPYKFNLYINNIQGG